MENTIKNGKRIVNNAGLPRGKKQGKISYRRKENTFDGVIIHKEEISANEMEQRIRKAHIDYITFVLMDYSDVEAEKIKSEITKVKSDKDIMR